VVTEDGRGNEPAKSLGLSPIPILQILQVATRRDLRTKNYTQSKSNHSTPTQLHCVNPSVRPHRILVIASPFDLSFLISLTMAPSKKRKAPSTRSTPVKKVRIGQVSSIPDPSPTLSPAGRPRRTSVSEPQYSLTRRRSSTAQNETTVKPKLPEAQVKMKRGRPAATAAAKKGSTPKRGVLKSGTG